MSAAEKWLLRLIALVSLFVAIVALVAALSAQSHYVNQKQVNHDDRLLIRSLAKAMDEQASFNDAVFASQRTVMRVLRHQMAR